MRTTRPTIPYLLLAVIVVLVFAIADGAELRRENTELRRFITGELAEVAKIIGWQEICTGEELGVTRGQFVKMYEMLTKRDKQEMVLPDGLKRAIRQIAEGQNLKLVEGGK